MTGKILWQQLKSLVAIDTQSVHVQKELDANKKIINDNLIALSKAEVQLEEKRRASVQEQKNVDMLELHAQTLKTEDNRIRTALELIKNQKEYKALEHELESITKQRRAHEDLTIKALYALEQAKKSFAHETTRHDTIITQACEQNDAKIKQNELLAHQLEELQQQRATLLTHVPAEWVMRYDRMKHLVPDPLVPVMAGSCSACFYSVLHQDLVKLKKAGILLCRNCYRFLYYDEEEQQDARKATF